MEVSQSISYASSHKFCPLIGLTMHQLLEMKAQEHPDREMYVFAEDKERVTFKKFKDQVERLAAGLLCLGIKKGDRLAILSEKHMEFVLFIAVARSIGVVTIRILPTWPNSHIKDVLLTTNCKVLVLGRSPTDLYERMKSITTEGVDKESKILHLEAVIGVGVANQIGTYSIENIEKLGSDPKYTELFKIRKNEVKFDDDSDIFCTSGSTGLPKYVMHTHFNVINACKAVIRYIDEMPDKENRKILARNTIHVTGDIYGTMPPLLAGVTAVYPSSVHDIKLIAKTIQDERCTDTFLLIHHLYDILNSKDIGDYDISSLTVCYTGGSTVPLKLMQDLERKNGTKVISLYGSTETFGMTSSMPWDPVELRYSAGKPLPNIEIQVVDDDGKCVPVGSVGEVWCRGSRTFRRYLGDEKATQLALTKHRWFKTGDLGIVDDSGVLTIVGRKKDMIIRGGHSVLPAPVENALSQHPLINYVQVIGVPDKRLGEEICACIKPEKGVSFEKDQIIAYLTGKIIGEDLPGHVLIFDSFPSTDSGKIDRISLTEQAIQRLIAQDTAK